MAQRIPQLTCPAFGWACFLLTVFVFQCTSQSKTTQDLPKNLKPKINGLSFVGVRQVLDSTHFEPVKAVYADWIALMPYAFARQDCTKLWYDQARQWWGEKKEGILQSITLARQAKLKIMLKPHIWIGRGGFTGHFDFKRNQDWAKWEANYRAYILQYALIADSLQVEMLCIGTEFENFVQKRPQFWTELIKEIRTVYKGKLTYAANWDEYQSVPFWADLDYIGIDAYFPLTQQPKPALEQLLAAWQKDFEAIHRLSQQYQKSVLFTEFGYQSVKGTTIKPWEEKRNAEFDSEEQIVALEAVFQKFYTQDWFKGGFLWKWFPLHQYTGGETDRGFTPQNKPAQEKITQWHKAMRGEEYR